ncbi:bifunctional folylpolyglutamate synthase/dihydrofolate synthase [Terrihabitans soli]|uniref:tetrahydrofolate synthase n=1 Tax=Terrihabitans soli TaxID=708113 RepID=A0A6S6QYL0_9HYPH|nr:folylpolyglutamate synthase/dihydrofolate synthase family protein [Terrihabitans soli]BCJ92121.1 bifunctional folylpolyglutamate synthase/dihydrofolate synthase [Terrihabitans soli]
MDDSGTILARFLKLHLREIDLSLGRMERLLAALGHPEKSVPPVLHVAGTNGKGSTVAFLRAMLEAAGKSVHVYTSPHLVRFHERIRLAGTLVDEAALVDALMEAERVNDGAPITQFEITTAAAFLLFARHPADVLILEVGLGGRLDATNVVERPLASIITPVSVDHTKFLGDTVEEIAIEKAGILKKGVPAIVSQQLDSVRDVIEACAARVRAGPLHISMQDWQAREERGRLVFEDENGLLDIPPPRLPGRHQFENAGTAIAALRALPQLGITPAHIDAGVQNADWPARLQRITRGKLLDMLPPESELWLDGGHNPAGARVVAETMGDLEERVARPLVLISGILNTKDSDGFFEPFRGLAAAVHTVPIVMSDAGLSPEDVAVSAENAGLPARAHKSLESALRSIGVEHGELAPRVLIAGSLYLAGEVLDKNGTPPA